MTKLTQKKVKFEWGDKQEAAFQLLKQKLCSAPILAFTEQEVKILSYDLRCIKTIKGFGAVIDAKGKGYSYGLMPVRIKYSGGHIKSLGTSFRYEYGISHPQTDGTKRENHFKLSTICLRACVIDLEMVRLTFAIVEFSYNNSYHASIKLHPLRHFMVEKGRSSKRLFVGLRLEKFNSPVPEIYKGRLRKSFKLNKGCKPLVIDQKRATMILNVSRVSLKVKIK
ncbi:hypothetical protein Tco_0823698 [Tanacetum coccineum]|uniref:Reverse transcriptase domain-containing protein n=1 Tax=Tanacetum coccineum TaxID=301880 RepID=A0ABQ5ANM3_9ASTR